MVVDMKPGTKWDADTRAITRARRSWTFARVFNGGKRAETLREAMVALYRKARRENEKA